MAKKSNNLKSEDVEALADYLFDCQHDPLKFVEMSFPWGEPGTPLENETGPAEWQRDIMANIRDGLISIDGVIRNAVASGNGIGKSALVAWLILWAIGTYPETRGVVTANTDTQLRTKTWPELAKWYHMWIARDLFEYTSTSIYSKEADMDKTWRIDCIPWNEDNPESFAGLHNKNKRILLIFDEASSIADIIWETSEGALTDKDTEIVWCAFGNPTRRNGRFYECFHKHRNLWYHKQINGEDVPHTNKKVYADWREQYGADSDFYKIHVLGQFPNSNEKQFISTKLVDAARQRVLKEQQFNFAPKIIGLDCAWAGKDKLMCYLRQGLFCKRLFSIPVNDDDLQVAAILARAEDEEQADAVFLDLAYGTGVKSAGKAWGRDWTLVAFNGASTRPDCKNKRAEMWANCRDWLKNGGALPPDDQQLADDLTAPELAGEDIGKIQLESKKSMKARGVPSPDSADALVLTFAYDVRSKRENQVLSTLNRRKRKYDPFGRR